jgi:hypothetical protein
MKRIARNRFRNRRRPLPPPAPPPSPSQVPQPLPSVLKWSSRARERRWRPEQHRRRHRIGSPHLLVQQTATSPGCGGARLRDDIAGARDNISFHISVLLASFSGASVLIRPPYPPAYTVPTPVLTQ